MESRAKTAVRGPVLRVGSTTDDQFNVITLPLVPIGCFRVDDIRFAFGTSFVTTDPADDQNDIRKEMRFLEDLLEANPQSPLGVFGHADPVGNDDFNKQLSGRRATVIYALLISTTDPDSAVKLWQGVARAESWGSKERQHMRTVTGLPERTPESELFKAYMQKLMPPTLKIAKKDFLGAGKYTEREGRLPGMQRIQPATDLFQAEERRVREESGQDGAKRRQFRQPTSQVPVQKGSKVEPASWPCPRATEGVAGCRARFFSDGESRRTRRLPTLDRTFDDKQDTFACRFYHKLLTDSPCETAMTLVKIRLFDAQARPLPFAPCLVTESGQKPRAARATGAPPTPLGTTAGSPPGTMSGGDKEEALITLRVQKDKLPATVNLKWSRPKDTENAGAPLPNPADPEDFEFHMDVTVDAPYADRNAAATRRLKNLGYDINLRPPVPGLGNPIEAFQRDYQPQFPDIVVDGTLNQPTSFDDSKTAHDATTPVRGRAAISS